MPRTRHRFLLLVVATALAACTREDAPTAVRHLAPPARPSAERIASVAGPEDLGSLTTPGGNVWASGVNDEGDIVGLASAADGREHAFLKNAGGAMEDLGTLPGKLYSRAIAINDAGLVVGSSSAVPFRWTRAAGMTPLTTPGTGSGEVTDVNAAGEVTGWYYGVSGTAAIPLPVYWRADGSPVPLALPTGASTGYAEGLNDAGDIVGSANTPDGKFLGVLWPAGGAPIVVSPPPGFNGGAILMDIGNTGVIVGGAAIIDGGMAASPTVWMSARSTPQVLDGSFGYARSVSRDTIVAGYGRSGAWVWSPQSGLQKLPLAGANPWQVQVTRVNDHGGVVGALILNGGDRAVRWTESAPPADITPPVITPAIAGTLGQNGWYTSDVTLTWTEADPESGVKSTTGCEAVTVSEDTPGESSTCSATNGAGLTSTNSETIKRDATPPAIGYTGNAGTYTVDQTIAITCTASDAMSGLANSTCANIGGDAYTFSLGTHSYAATATDLAGNSGQASTSFVVQVTYASLGNLTQRWVTNAGVANSLTSKLAAAASGSPGALQGYLHEVEAQAGKKIPANEAAILERLAQAL